MLKKDKNKKNSKEEKQAPQSEEPQGQEPEKSDPENDYQGLWDKYLRLQADFDNYRKRSFKERAEFIKFANEGLIMELLNILDNFERGIKAAEQKEDFNLLHQGVDMISKQLHSLLQTKGLNRIESIGREFDPHKHEALEVVEDDSVDSDTIEDELQPGYILNGRVIRPAKVKVKRKKPDNQDEACGEKAIEKEKIDNQESKD